MTTIETALLHGVNWMLDNRTMLKANLSEPEIKRMNEVLRGMANALDQSIDDGWPKFREEMIALKGPAWGGRFEPYKTQPAMPKITP